MVDPNHFHQMARHIRTRVPTILAQWGLPPRFNRWRLTQDPDSGMVVLFAVLNSKYITAHRATPSNDYFDPHLLRNLANDLQVRVVPSITDGWCYAFILDRGTLDPSPMHSDAPVLDGERLLVGVVYNDELIPRWITPKTTPAPSINVEIADDHTRDDRGVGAFLKVFDDIRVKDYAPSQLSASGMSHVVGVNEAGVNNRDEEHEVTRQRSNRIRRLFDEST